MSSFMEFETLRVRHEFQRMTGHPPQTFMLEVSNEFGRRLLVRQASST
jgi:hypothetical protein